MVDDGLVNQHPTVALESVCLYVTTSVSRNVFKNSLGRSGKSITKITMVALP
jgi:hypothetical protein